MLMGLMLLSPQRPAPVPGVFQSGRRENALLRMHERTMPLDFRSARLACLNLGSRLSPGALIALPNGRRYHVLVPALHSETLEPSLVILRADLPFRAEFGICAPGAARVIDIDADLPASFAPMRGGAVFRHRKGGVYTRVGQTLTRDGEMTIYVSHADGTWWVRPREMFDDGRFIADPDHPGLNMDELGLTA